jgi:hypothetical protein
MGVAGRSRIELLISIVNSWPAEDTDDSGEEDNKPDPLLE